MHYSSHEGSELTDVFSKESVICKLGDLREARSIITQTSMTVCKTRARFVIRGSPAFMVPEIQIKTQLKNSAGINDMKKIDIWALRLTLFLIVNLNLSRRYKYELQTKYPGKTFCKLAVTKVFKIPKDCVSFTKV